MSPRWSALRLLLPADVDALLQLERASFGPGHAWSARQLDALLCRPDAVALGLGGQGALAGAALGWCAGPVGELLRIAVHPDTRRGGLGRRLLEDFMQRCRDLGAEELWLELRSDNIAALGLYHSAGFVQTGQRPAYYADGGDAVLMSLALESG